MTMRERVAAAAFERSMAQLKARYPVPDETIINDETWETCGTVNQHHWRGVIDAILDALTAYPGEDVLDAALGKPMEDENGINCHEHMTTGETFCAMIKAIRDGK